MPHKMAGKMIAGLRSGKSHDSSVSVPVVLFDMLKCVRVCERVKLREVYMTENMIRRSEVKVAKDNLVHGK
jgi:hypothetical protein